MKKSLLLALSLAFAAAAPAYAEDSPWSVKFGLGWVNPKSDNGRLANAFDAEVSSELNLTPAIEYRLSDNWSTELLLAVPFKHDVKLNGTEAASFKHLPPTLSLKYLFSPDQVFSPYIGAGLNYTLVFDEETRGPIAGTKLSGDNSFGPALVAGFEYRNNSPWGVAVDLRWIDIDSELRLNGARIGDLNVDPIVANVSVTYHF